jgi:hypothetical protein
LRSTPSAEDVEMQEQIDTSSKIKKKVPKKKVDEEEVKKSKDLEEEKEKKADSEWSGEEESLTASYQVKEDTKARLHEVSLSSEEEEETPIDRRFGNKAQKS